MLAAYRDPVNVPSSVIEAVDDPVIHVEYVKKLQIQRSKTCNLISHKRSTLKASCQKP